MEASPSCKLVMLGKSAAGKSSLAAKFVKGVFNEDQESTIGAAFFSHDFPLEDHEGSPRFKFEIWDTAGQERYNSLTPIYYRGARAAILVFDVTSESSFTTAKDWVNKLKLENEGIVIGLAGNKIDIVTKDPSRRAVPSSVAEEYAKEAGLLYMETSARTAENVTEIFRQIARRVLKDYAKFRKVRSTMRRGVDLRPEAPNTQGAGGCNC